MKCGLGLALLHAHGLNERAIVKAVYSGRDFLTELVKDYAEH